MSKPFITITNEDIFNKITDVEKHAIYTNGKIAQALLQIAEMEKDIDEHKEASKEEHKKVLLNIIGRHPFKFAMIVMLFFGTVLSDIRHPVIDLLAGFIL